MFLIKKLVTCQSVFVFLLLVLSSSCSSKKQLTEADKSRQPTARELEIARHIQKEINEQRVKNGHSKLTMHPTLNRLAMNHSIFLAKNGGEFGLYGKNISHKGFKGRSALAYKYNKLKIAENVGYARGKNNKSRFGNANYIVKLWLASSGHKAQISQPAWRKTGVGVVVKNDGVIITQLFGRMSTKASTKLGDPRVF